MVTKDRRGQAGGPAQAEDSECGHGDPFRACASFRRWWRCVTRTCRNLVLHQWQLLIDRSHFQKRAASKSKTKSSREMSGKIVDDKLKRRRDGWKERRRRSGSLGLWIRQKRRRSAAARSTWMMITSEDRGPNHHRGANKGGTTHHLPLARSVHIVTHILIDEEHQRVNHSKRLSFSKVTFEMVTMGLKLSTS